MPDLSPLSLDALQQAVEGLYAAFAHYPLSSLEGCPCCVSGADKGQVTHRTLRELTKEDLGRYAGKAMTTWGTVDDFKHFLPRIFDLTADFRAPYDEYPVFDKLAYGRWRTWPAAEVEALERYCRALWDVVLVSDAWHFHDYFVALAGIYPRFEELLQRWQASTSPAAWALLAEEVYQNSSAIFENKYFNCPYLSSIPLSRHFRAWATSPAVREKIFEAFSQCSQDATADKLGVAYDLIDYELKYPSQV